VRTGPDGEADVAAWIVPQPEERPTARALRAWLADRLPAHFLPAAWCVVPALPLTPAGKVDGAALPGPERPRPEASDRPEGPPLVALVAAAFAEVLGAGRVGPDENFFELGGHSLTATRLVARLRERAAPELPLGAVFEAPTPRTLAERIAAARGAEPAPPIRRRDGEAPPPASLAQQRLWILERITPGSAALRIDFAVRVHGPLDRGRLEAALAELALRHEPLRTGLQERDGVLRQVPASPPAAGSGRPYWPVDPREAGAEPFDLARGPLWRVRLDALGPEEHRLAFSFHHAVFDGWSEAVLVRDLGALYAGRPVEPLAVGYGDFAHWQRERAASGELARQVRWWKDELAGMPALNLPTDGARPALLSPRGAAVGGWIGPADAERLRGLARAEGATLFMVLLAAWEVWLWRHSGQTDFGVGVPVAGRTRRELEEMIGLFVNTLVIRADVGESISFRDLVRRVRERTLRAYDRQEAPFEQVVEAAQPERDLGRTPLFQTMFSLQNAPRAGRDFGPVRIEPMPVAAAGAKFELTLTAAEADDGRIGLNLEFSEDLFGAASAERFLARFLEIVRAAGSAGAAARLADLAWLPAAEIATVAAWSRSSSGLAPPPGGATLPDLFEAQAARRPEAIAVSAEAATLNYGALNARANRLAHLLIARGIGPEDRVALCLPRSPDLVVAILAVLKAGAAYVPLDPEYPPDRLAFLRSDAGAAAVLTTAEGATRLSGGAATIVLDAAATRLDLDGRPATNPRDSDRRRTLHPLHPAYIIYTSGSTGTPKGVIVHHRNVVRLFAAADPEFGFGANDVWTLFHAYTFDFAVWELWGPLLYGGRLVIVPFLTSRSPGDFRRLLAREGVTVLNQTPSAFYQLMQADRELPAGGPPLALRWIIFGGEALRLDRLEDWYARHADDAPVLVNMYGITETTVHVTFRRLSRAGARMAGGSLIGRGLPDLQVSVLDSGLRPVGVDVAGELHVAGEGLARGYLNRPELTAERFVPDPDGPPGSRMYRSGDLARWRPDGGLEYLGRGDHQVKIRGFRVELGEIEAVLARQAGVAQAVAIVREDQPGQPRLVAYVVPAAGAVADPGDLRRRLADRLPDYMVPAAIVPLERLPLTVNGKLDRRALPNAAAAAPSGGVAPQGPVETFMAALWSELLDVPSVGRDDNFFMLGGHSLLATQFISRVREQLEIELPLVSLFEDATPAGCARAAVASEPAPGHAEKFARVRLRLRAMSAAEKESRRALVGP
jgi:nonribosomal peptide synthetase DhbF